MLLNNPVAVSSAAFTKTISNVGAVTSLYHSLYWSLRKQSLPWTVRLDHFCQNAVVGGQLPCPYIKNVLISGVLINRL